MSSQTFTMKHQRKVRKLNVFGDNNKTHPDALSFIVSELPQYPNVDPFNYDTMKKMLIEKLDSFAAAPFTIQRISELLSDPRKQYSRIDKFMRAVEKTILVVSTVPPGRHRSESENGDSLDSALNGDFASEVNVDIDMESHEDGSFAVTKEVSVTTQSKEQNHEVSTISHETITITKSPSKEDEAGPSESTAEITKEESKAAVETDAVAPAETTNVSIESSSTVTITVIEPQPTEADKDEETGETSANTSSTSVAADVIKAPEATVAPEITETPVESKLEKALNEPIRSTENEILVDTVEIISETTPLAALENIVAIRTDPVVEVLVEVEPLIVIPEVIVTTEDEVVQTPDDAEESESEAKRLKLSEADEVASEPPVLTEAIVQVEEPPQEGQDSDTKSDDTIVTSEPPVLEPAVETIISAEPIEVVVASEEPKIEQKIDEPLPEVAEIPVEVASPSEQNIVEAPLTAMETVPTIAENKMSLDEDEPPAPIELEMTPIANEMDTDEVEAAPMDFEDDAEPMDQ